MRVYSKISFTGALALLLLAGCGTSSQLVVLPAVAPNCGPTREPQSAGVLQVYSARVPADTDINFEEFFAGDDFGGNQFPLEPAHTDYSIYTQDGQLVHRIHNASNLDDGQPAKVALPEGAYNIHAVAKDASPGTFGAVVPILIQAGCTTRVYIDGDWHPPVSGNTGSLATTEDAH